MNPYLTEKACRKKHLEGFLLFTLAFLATGCIGAAVQTLQENRISTCIGCLFFLVITCYPMYRILRRRVLQRKAQAYGARLESIPYQVMSFEQAGEIFPAANALKNIQMLIDKGFLQNVFIDYASLCMHLSGPRTRKTTNAYDTLECPGCGATNKVVRGLVGNCVYCGIPLSSQDTTSKKKE